MPIVVCTVATSAGLVIGWAGGRLSTLRTRRTLAVAATVDHLTGLPNRAGLGALHAAVQARATGTAGWISVVQVDLDRFKLINDMYGHEVGDLLLAAAAERLDAVALSWNGAAVRLGGDEFVLIAPVTSTSSGPEMATQVRRALGGESYLVAGRRIILDASAGAAVGVPADLLPELLRAADQAMYAAKLAHRRLPAPPQPSHRPGVSGSTLMRPPADEHSARLGEPDVSRTTTPATPTVWNKAARLRSVRHSKLLYLNSRHRLRSWDE